MHALARAAADVALDVHERHPEAALLTRLVPWVQAQLGPAGCPLAQAVRARSPAVEDLGAEPVQEHVLRWRAWLADGLDQAWLQALMEVRPQHPCQPFFRATLGHVIAPDEDLHVELDGDALVLLRMGGQFDLARARRDRGLSPGSMAPPDLPALHVPRTVAAPCRTLDDLDTVARPIPAHTLSRPGWLSRPDARDPTRPASAYVDGRQHRRVERSSVRSLSLRAAPNGVLPNRLICTLDHGEERPAQLTMFGPGEIWAALTVLVAWSGHDLGGTLALRLPGWQVL